MKELMQRFIASSIAGQAPGFAQFGEETIHLPNSEWPGTGFEGWFLLAAMYPRMAMKGFITFVSLSTQASSHSMLLDIEYATWANPESEVLFFRETAASPDGESSSRAEKDLVLCTRPDSDIILRHRPSRKGSDYSIHPHLREIALAEHECSVIASMDWASMNSKATWWIDVDRSLQPRGSRAELGIDRHLESVHLAVCGWRFISLKHEDAVWAVSRGADSGRWVEGAALKVPKLDGAITLWNATSARGVLQTWREEGRPVEFELFLERMRETGELAVVQLSASAQGWQTR